MPLAGRVMRVVTSLALTDSLERALLQMQRQQLTELPVVDEGRLCGWVREARIAALLPSSDAARHAPIAGLQEPPPLVISPALPLVQAINVFCETGACVLPVLAPDGSLMGVLTRGDALQAMLGHTPATPRIGGMATPLGVYLTTGSVSTGAGLLGLLLTGAVLCLASWVAQTVVMLASLLLAHWTGITRFADIYLLQRERFTGSPIAELTLYLISMVATLVIFFGLFRLMPRIPGYHAAEHQTVNAIEAGEPLTPEAVGRMSRVHPRCGTNIWTIAMLVYFGVTALALILSTRVGQQNLSLVAMLAVLLVLLLVATWKRLGSWVQAMLTTRPASPAEIASGIRAGEAILRQALHARPSHKLSRRIWHMGLLQVAIGALATGYLVQLLDPYLDVLYKLLVK